MIKFNLEQALNGAKVITRDGREATQLTYFSDVINEIKLYAVVDGNVFGYSEDGGFRGVCNPLDLFMAPEMMSGFICYHCDGACHYFKEKPNKEMYSDGLMAIIDLSQFPVGYGLEDE